MPSSTRRDIASAYLATLTKIGSWAAVSALTYRRLGPDAFALLALVRSTLGLLNYTSLGLAPALVHQLAKFHATWDHRHAERSEESPPAHIPSTIASAPTAPPTLSYATPPALTPRPPHPAQRTYTTGLLTALFLFLAGLVLLLAFGSHATVLLKVQDIYRNVAVDLITTFGFGLLARFLSDPAGAALQTFDRITTDNILLAITDLLWVTLYTLTLTSGATVNVAGTAFLWSNLLLLLTRYLFARRILPLNLGRTPVDPAIAGSLLSFGLLLTLAQLADFLYAPTDFLLINHLLSTKDLAAYAPCVQIDAALLLLVTGLSTALFPKAALAHARDDPQTLRRYYVQGTLFSTALLLPASLATWLAAPLLLRLWLHDIPPGTLAILPLVLLHTTLGGSSAVARSILLGAGKVKPFTASVLLAGVLNVLLSYTFVRHLHLGLAGIVLGTVIAVTARCAIWTPWYTLKTLRDYPAPNSLPSPLPPAEAQV